MVLIKLIAFLLPVVSDMFVWSKGKSTLRLFPFERQPISAIYIINRGYYMAARRYEIYLRVLKNISRVSAANE